MDRRGFLGTLFGGVAATAATRSWPFRVFSFPSEIKIETGPLPDEIFKTTPLLHYLHTNNLYLNNPLMNCRITNISVPTDEELEMYS